MNYLRIVINGIVQENPTFVLLLGMCPTLATTTSAVNGMSMGLATMFVLICSNVVISLVKNLTPDSVRIPVFVVIIASFVTILQMCLQAYLPSINKSLGIYIPLIVVNCIILGRARLLPVRTELFRVSSTVLESASGSPLRLPCSVCCANCLAQVLCLEWSCFRIRQICCCSYCLPELSLH